MADRTDSSGLLWFITGLAAGATISLLFAPASGQEIRSQIAKKTGEGRAALAGSGKDMLDRARETFERGRKLAEEAAELFEKGRRLIEDAAGSVEHS